MTLDANASMANIKRSLDKYCNDNLYSTEGLNVSFEGLPFENVAYTEWVQPRILDITTQYHRQGSSTQYGETASVLFQINIFTKKSGVTIADRHYMIRDIVADYFKIGKDISIANYVSGTTALDNLRIREVVTDSPLPETSTMYQYVLAWNMNY